MLARSTSLGLLLVLSIHPHAQVGSVTRSLTIGASLGGLGGTMGVADNFGGALAALGDLNGDGVEDLAVGAPGCDDGGQDRGAIWVLFLKSDGSAQSHTKISATQGGFTGALADGSYFGARLATVGDLDGDGVPELATFSGQPNRLWILFLKPDGSVKRQTENPFTDPVFVPATAPRHFNGPHGFGGLEALGDLDGDGLGDLAIGAPYDPDGVGAWTGALWIVRLAGDGTLKAAHKISQTQGGFSGTLHSLDLFGYTIVHLGDLDGDGNRELGVSSQMGPSSQTFWILNLDANELVSSQSSFGASDYLQALAFTWLGDLDGDGIGELAMASGGTGMTIGFLLPDGSVKKHLRNQQGGTCFARLGDLDADGALEIAAGSPAVNRIEILSLDPSVERIGSGLNTVRLSQAGDPVIGAPWSATLDCSGHASGLAIVLGLTDPTSGILTGYGEVLVTGHRLFYLAAPHTSGPITLQVNIPMRVDLIDLPIFVQGACAGAPGLQLSNALDLLVGR